ncbi:lysophospholipid acyltransferase family protein [bacterium]|nr:lysophospholipid acyltransferase family protein [bacterium]
MVYGLVVAALGVMRRLPLRFLYALAPVVGTLAWLLLWRQRRRAHENLALAFGDEKSPGERRRIGRGVFIHLARALGEALHAEELVRGRRCRVELAGLETLRELKEAGRSVVFVGAHFGPWELLTPLAAREGFAILAVARELADPRLDRFVRGLREAAGAQVFYTRGTDTLKLVRALRNGASLGILVDQNTRAAGIAVPFFGRPAHTPTGAMELAVATGSAVVPVFLRRQGYRRFAVEIQPPLDFPAGEAEARIRWGVEEITKRIEAVIREHPEQWVWMHRRWKDRAGRRRYQRFKTSGEGGR